jgi:hypothetical protein
MRRAIRHGVDKQARPIESAPVDTDASEWRWQGYTDHLGDLGYELEGATSEAEAVELAAAVAEYRRRSRVS